MSRAQMTCPDCGKKLYDSLICLKCQLKKDQKYQKMVADICKMVQEFQKLKEKAKTILKSQQRKHKKQSETGKKRS